MTTTTKIARHGERAVQLGLAWIVVLSLFLVATFGYGRDQGIYALVARTVLTGGMPYRDVFDFKPPGIYLIYTLARALFGAWPHGIRVLEVAGLAAMLFGMVRLAQRWWGEWRIGLLAGALAALAHAQLDFWHTGQPETFGGMLTVGAVVIATGEGRPRLRAVAAGLLFGITAILKPPLAGGGVVLALWLGCGAYARVAPWADLRARAAALLGPSAWVLLGGALPFAACLAWFAAKGALPAAHETFFVFTPNYTKLGWSNQTLLNLMYQAFAQWLVTFSSGISVGLFLALARWRAVWARRGVGLLLGIVATQLLGVALQGKFFPYHYAASWPLTALVAALGWWPLWCWGRARGGRGLLAFTALFVLSLCLRTASKDLPDTFFYRSAKRLRVYLWQRDDQAAIDELASVADVSARANREVAAALRAQVAPGAPIFIWGFEPVIYDLSDRPFASRYIYNVPQRVEWGREEARTALMADLRRQPPAVIVVARHDVFPMVTGNGIDSADVLEREYGELKGYLAEGYGEPTRIEDFEIFPRRP